ncbi:MAG: hypothetical protein MIO93_06425 [ANME-2 cluster archaeon]|nr:hypothetical protein [ANME-2 cluster archaeon]
MREKEMRLYFPIRYEDPHSKAVRISHDSIGAELALTMPYLNRNIAERYND